MKVSRRMLEDMGACIEGLERFAMQTKGSSEPVEIAELIGGKNTHSDFIWLALTLGRFEEVVKFACGCALINVDKIWPYSEPREYNGIITFLNNPNIYAAGKVYSIAIEAYERAIEADESMHAEAAQAVMHAAKTALAAENRYSDDALLHVLTKATAAALCASLTTYNEEPLRSQLNNLTLEMFKETKQ